jgi:hypothetical protein
MQTAAPRTFVKLLIGLALFIVPAVLIKGLVKDKVADANKAAGFENIPANAQDIDDTQSLYRAENFGGALAALEEHAGKNPELLEVDVMPYMAEFQIKDGQRAKGYRYYAKNGEMGEFKVKIVGGGSIEGSQFPYETIGAGVTEKLAASAAGQGHGLKVTNMTIRREIIDGHLAWSVNAESDERTGLVFQADPDGSGLADATQRALERSGASAGSAGAGAESSAGAGAKDPSSQADCLQAAAGDAAKIQACLD